VRVRERMMAPAICRRLAAEGETRNGVG